MWYTAGSSNELNTTYLKENGKSSSDTITEIDGTKISGQTHAIRLFVTGKGKLTIDCDNSNVGKYNAFDGSFTGTQLLDGYCANTTSEAITVTTSPLCITTSTKGYITKITWSPDASTTYTITYNTNGGSTIAQVTGATALPDPLPTPTKDGCTFQCWYTDESLSTQATAGAPITSNTTLYAKWDCSTSSTYTLSYNSNIPNPWSVETLPYTIASMPADESDITSTTVSTTTPTLKENDYDIYYFNGWNTKADGKGDSYAAGSTITLSANTTLYAQWQARSFSITYYDSDQTTPLTGLTPESYTYDVEATFPTPTKSGYTFVAWQNQAGTETYTSTKNYYGDFSLYAKWKKQSIINCTTLAEGKADNTDSTIVATVGTITITKGQWTDNSVKLSDDKDSITIKPDKGSFTVGDKISVTLYNKDKTENTLGCKFNSGAQTIQVSAKSTAVLEYTLAAKDIKTDGTIIFKRTSSTDRYRDISVERCVEQTCTTSVTLTWSSSAYTYDEGDQPTLTVSPKLPTGSNIQYTSSDESIASISDDGQTITPHKGGTVTITALFEGDDTYCPAEASYQLTINCNIPELKITGKDVLEGCNESITLQAVLSDGTAYPTDGYTFQWYRDDNAIADATSATYTTDVVGTYYVIAQGAYCEQRSTNTATITSRVPVPEAKRLTRFQYYRPGNTYPSVSNTRHLLAYKSVVENDSTRCDLSATIIRGTTHTALSAEAINQAFTVSTTQNAAGLYEITTTCNEGLRHLDSQLQAGDTLRVKVTPYDNCGEPFPDYADSVDIYIVSKPSLAFIVSGANDYTRNTKNYKIGGDFLTGINKANLCIQSEKDWKDADKATVLPLYKTLCDSFVTVPVNAYADFDSLNYEPFDLVFLTDFVKTDAGNDSITKAKCNAAINNLGRLVDYRPMFSTKGYMAKTDFTIWADKGFTGNPYDVKTKRDMTVLCYAHDIFTGLKEWTGTGTPSSNDSCNYVMRDANENIYIRVLSEQGFDSNKGMQGFSEVDKNSFINIATIHGEATSGKKTFSQDTTLIACAERQTNIEARLMVLCINADATSFITPVGLHSIVRALNYLLITEPAHVSDCSLTFDNGATHTGGGDNKWSNPNNWNSGHLPLSHQNVQIVADCVVDSKDAHAANIKILSGVTVTITDSAALTAIGKVNTLLDKTNSSKTQDLTDPNTIRILSTANGNGAFIHNTKAGESLPATVQLYSKSYRTAGDDGKYTYYWQYVGIPTQEAQVPECFHGAYTYVWKEATKWERHGDYSTIYGFEGVGLTEGIGENETKTYTLKGNLNTTETKNINITAQATDDYKGMNIIGNSWTAPLQVGKFTAADFGSCISPCLYIYNSGKDDTYHQPSTGDYANIQPGTWTTLTPSLVIQSTYTGPTVIPAMQAFYVKTTKDTTFTLDYARLVHNIPAKEINTPLRAPRRNAVSSDEVEGDDAWAHAGETFGEPVQSYKKVSTMRVTLADNRSSTSLYLMEDDMFSDAYDNGYDAPQLFFNDRKYAPTLFALSELGNMAVLAVQDIDNTHLAYRGGSNETCTFSFGYNGDRTLYLNDALLRRSTPINNYNTYSFSVADTTERNRFYISAIPIEDKTTTSIVEVVQYNNQLQLSNPAGEMLTIDIYDAAGRIVMQRRSAETMIVVETPASNGVYLIHAFGEQTNLLHKIVR